MNSNICLLIMIKKNYFTKIEKFPIRVCSGNGMVVLNVCLRGIGHSLPTGLHTIFSSDSSFSFAFFPRVIGQI